MSVEFKEWQNPAAGLFECQACGAIVPFSKSEDKLAKHAIKHKGENK